VDDIVQDVFLAAMQRSRSFRGHSSLGTLAHGHHASTAAERIGGSCGRFGGCTYACRDAAGLCCQRGPGRRRRIDASLAVRAAVAALARRRDREVIVLHYLENKPVGEISQLLNVSANAVDVRLPPRPASG